MNSNAYKAYKQQSVTTMTPGDMLTLLYDGLIKEISLAQIALKKNDIVEANLKLQKGQAILRHLRSSLDQQYDISNSLDTLYDFFLHGLIQANIKKDGSGLDDIIQMVSELRNTYIQADKKTRSAEAMR